MAIVNERQSKPTQVDPKTGKPLPPAVPPRSGSPSLDMTANNDSGFFGSFFASKNKKKAASMEPPPPSLKASGTLSDKENNEVEVISKLYNLGVYVRVDANRLSPELLISSYYNIVKRTLIDMVPKAVMLTLVQYVTSIFILK